MTLVDGAPETQCTALGEDRIVDQVYGEGEVDLLLLLLLEPIGDCIDLRR